jgi:hypothetical protein
MVAHGGTSVTQFVEYPPFLPTPRQPIAFRHRQHDLAPRSMLICPAIGDTDPIRCTSPSPGGQLVR